jgi:hypothetical protein
VIRISHRNLEEARADPEAYARRMPKKPESRGGLSISRCWQLAAFEFHKRSGDANAAETYFDDLCSGFQQSKLNLAKIRQYREALRKYVVDFRALGHVNVSVMVRMSVDLGSDVRMVGEIGRVDVVVKGGYGAYLIGRTPGDWRSELRMPLLQRYVAGQVGTRVEMVKVGAYSVERGYEERQFTRTEVAAATREAEEIARRVVRAGAAR